jgi:hypothetical protein
MPVDARTEKLIRRTTMVGTATAAYFLLTSDFGPHPNALDPVRFLFFDFSISFSLIMIVAVFVFNSSPNFWVLS